MELKRFYGENVSRLRKAAGLKQKELGEALGVSASYVSQIESGVIGFSSESLERTAIALRCSPSDLLRSPNEEAESAHSSPAALIRQLLDGVKTAKDRVNEIVATSDGSISELTELRKLKSELERIYGPDGIDWLLKVDAEDAVTPQTVLLAAGKPVGLNQRQPKESSLKLPSEGPRKVSKTR